MWQTSCAPDGCQSTDRPGPRDRCVAASVGACAQVMKTSSALGACARSGSRWACRRRGWRRSPPRPRSPPRRPRWRPPTCRRRRWRRATARSRTAPSMARPPVICIVNSKDVAGHRHTEMLSNSRRARRMSASICSFSASTSANRRSSRSRCTKLSDTGAAVDVVLQSQHVGLHRDRARPPRTSGARPRW